MCSSYGLKPHFDVKEEPIFSNIKLIAKKAKENGKIAGIHNGYSRKRNDKTWVSICNYFI